MPTTSIPIICGSFTRLGRLVLGRPVRRTHVSLSMPIRSRPMPRLSRPLSAKKPKGTVRHRDTADTETTRRVSLPTTSTGSIKRGSSNLHLKGFSSQSTAETNCSPRQVKLNSKSSSAKTKQQPELHPKMLTTTINKSLSSRRLTISKAAKLLQKSLSNGTHAPRLSKLSKLTRPPQQGRTENITNQARSMTLRPRLVVGAPLSANKTITPSTSACSIRPQRITCIPGDGNFSARALVPFGVTDTTRRTLRHFRRRRNSVSRCLTAQLNCNSMTRLRRCFDTRRISTSTLTVDGVRQNTKFVANSRANVNGNHVYTDVVHCTRRRKGVTLFVAGSGPLCTSVVQSINSVKVQQFAPFVASDNARVPLTGNTTLGATKTTGRRTRVRKVVRQNGLKHCDTIFAACDRLRAIKGGRPLQQDFLHGVTPGTVLVLSRTRRTKNDGKK